MELGGGTQGDGPSQALLRCQRVKQMSWQHPYILLKKKAEGQRSGSRDRGRPYAVAVYELPHSAAPGLPFPPRLLL